MDDKEKAAFFKSIDAQNSIGQILLDGSAYIGCGISRKVFHYEALDVVLKLANDPRQNLVESETFWELPKVAQPFFAECLHMSIDGKVLLQRYYPPLARVIHNIDPNTPVPTMFDRLHDFKLDSLGYRKHKGKFIPVIVDYGMGLRDPFEDGVIYSGMTTWEKVSQKAYYG